VSFTKTAGLIEMPFWHVVMTYVGPRDHVSDEGPYQRSL